MADVFVCEMVPRDGLQSLSPERPLSAEGKATLVDLLSASGLRFIEVGSFVSTRAVPQMANTDDVCRRITKTPGVQYAALVPNVKHYQRFRDSGVDTLALFVSASERYSQLNLRQSIAESYETTADLAGVAGRDGVRLRAHLSACFADIDGSDSDIDQVIEWTRRLIGMGCEHVALADTKGTTHPLRVRIVLDRVFEAVGTEHIAVHFHDSFGAGIANCFVAYECGARVFDGSVGGIGGTPFTEESGMPGGGGNIATEELVAMFERMGVETGIDLDVLINAGRLVAQMVDETGSPPLTSKLIR